MENKVNYSHFTPERNEHQACSQIIGIIDELAPSDSYVQAQIDQAEDGSFNSSIHVSSCNGDFKAESSGFSLLSSLKKAQRGILDNMEEWKRKRFLHS